MLSPEKTKRIAIARRAMEKKIALLQESEKRANFDRNCDLLIARIEAIQAYVAEVSAICAR